MKLEATIWMVFATLVALSFLFPKVRAFSFSALGVAIAAIMAIILVAKRGETPAPDSPPPPAVEQKPVDFEKFLIDKLDKTDPAAKTRVRVDEIRFDQVHPEAGGERGSIGAVVARLYNDSTDNTLTDYGYSLVVQDCIKAICTTVFDQHGMSAVSVPPHQARDVRITLRDAASRDTPATKIFGTPNILLTPTATRAQPASDTPVD